MGLSMWFIESLKSRYRSFMIFIEMNSALSLYIELELDVLGCHLLHELHYRILRICTYWMPGMVVGISKSLCIHQVPCILPCIYETGITALITTRSCFLINFWKMLWNKLGYKLQFNSAYHHQTNSQDEEVNNSLGDMGDILRCLASERSTQRDNGVYLGSCKLLMPSKAFQMENMRQ